MVYTFGSPYSFEGTEYTEINIDVDALTGGDIANIKRQWVGEQNFAVLPAMDTEFCMMVAARASGQPLEFFREMPAKDYCKLTAEVSGFLIA